MNSKLLKEIHSQSLRYTKLDDISRARKLMHEAWRGDSQSAQICFKLAALHQLEAQLRHQMHGHNGKILFIIRGYFLSFYLPLLLRFAPEQLDIHISLTDGWGVGDTASRQLEERGFYLNRILPREEWSHYQAVFMDHCEDYLNTDDYIPYPPLTVHIAHTTVYTDSGQPYLSHSLCAYEAQAREQAARAPWVQCGWAGPLQIEDAAIAAMQNDIRSLRNKVFEALGISAAAGPIVVCYSTCTDNPLELAEGLRQLSHILRAKGGIVVLKPFPSDKEQLAAQDLGDTLFWSAKGAGGDILRLAADVILTGFSTSALITALLMGKRIIPYHTEQEQVGIYRKEQLVLAPRFTYSPERNPRGWSITQMLGGSVSITDMRALGTRMDALVKNANYDAVLQKIRNKVLGQSEIHTPVSCASAMLHHLLTHNSFPLQRSCPAPA